MIKIGAIFDGFRTRKDGSICLTFETQEINSTDGAAIIALRNKFGHLLFAEREPEDSDLPIDPPKSAGDRRTPSQRLRAVIYRIWEVRGSTLDFDVFYKAEIERLIDWYKGKLES